MAAAHCVWVVDETSAQDHVVRPGKTMSRLSVSPDGQFVAAFTSDGFLIVLTSGEASWQVPGSAHFR